MSLMSLARALPDPVKNAIKATRDNTGLALVRLFSSSGFLASVYYCLISREFDREHRAVLLGRLNFAKRMRGQGENDAFLRRNVHRLEKGLIMRPRRSTFAEDYIGPTVRCYANATQAGVINGHDKHHIFCPALSAKNTAVGWKVSHSMFWPSISPCPPASKMLVLRFAFTRRLFHTAGPGKGF